MKEYRGTFDRGEVLDAMATTRISPENQKLVLNYLCDGVRIKDLGVTKQQAYARIKKVVDIINAA